MFDRPFVKDNNGSTFMHLRIDNKNQRKSIYLDKKKLKYIMKTFSPVFFNQDRNIKIVKVKKKRKTNMSKSVFSN